MTTTLQTRLGTAPEEGMKAPCAVATVSNITLSGEFTHNGHAIVAGDRVLVRAQTDAKENGIYDASTGAWTRATDWNGDDDVESGQLVTDSANNEVYQAIFTGTFQLNITEVTFTATGLGALGSGTIGGNVGAADTGSADAYAIAPSPAISAYVAYQVFRFVAANDNTGASTLNVNGLGVKSIKKPDGSALEAGNIQAGGTYQVTYDGTNFVLQTGAIDSKDMLHLGGGAAETVSDYIDRHEGFSGWAALLAHIDANGIQNGKTYRLRYHTNVGEGGGFFRGVTGAAAATYSTDGGTILIPTAGDGSAALIREYTGALYPSMFGAVGDGLMLTDATITATDQTLTSASNPFTAADVGKSILIVGAGTAGAVLVTTIASYTGAGSVELTAAAGTTVSGVRAYYGTDDTSALQKWINAIANLENGRGDFEAKAYCFTRLYPYYDVTNNPDFPSGNYDQGSLTILGAGAGSTLDYKQNKRKGTALLCVSADGGVIWGLPTASNSKYSRAMTIGSFAMYGSSTATGFNNFTGIPHGSVVINMVTVNDTQDTPAVLAEDVWECTFMDHYIYGGTAQTPGSRVGEGFVLQTGYAGGGNILCKNINSEEFGTGIRFGKAYNAGNFIAKNITVLSCQGASCDIGTAVRHGIQGMRIHHVWGESNYTTDLEISNSATDITVGGHVTSIGLDAVGAGAPSTDYHANVVVGLATGTAAVDAAYNITFDAFQFYFCATGTAGLRKHPGAKNVRVKKNCSFKNNGGYAIWIDSTEAAQIAIEDVDYFPPGASSTFGADTRVCSVGAGPAATNLSYLPRECPDRNLAVTAALDMSGWEAIPDVIIADTLTTGSFTITFPSDITEWRGESHITKAYAANTLTLDFGTKTYEGATTKAITTAYQTEHPRHRGATSSVWDSL